jgi:hypothetical protein
MVVNGYDLEICFGIMANSERLSDTTSAAIRKLIPAALDCCCQCKTDRSLLPSGIVYFRK